MDQYPFADHGFLRAVRLSIRLNWGTSKGASARAQAQGRKRKRRKRNGASELLVCPAFNSPRQSGEE
jgi:hypothetical protein